MSRRFWYGVTMPERPEPIGLEITRTGRALSREFNDALTAAGGSLPQWLVLITLKQSDHRMQRDIAAAIGIEGATLTHHLHRMEADGFIHRRRGAGDRRSQLVELTPAGEQLFTRLRHAVIEFDERLRRGISDRELAALRRLLERLRTNASSPPESTSRTG
jgi:MarR family transcriptional regulator, transcriptional regulator for hemolysin